MVYCACCVGANLNNVKDNEAFSGFETSVCIILMYK
jgi:hypothetical protein